MTIRCRFGCSGSCIKAARFGKKIIDFPAVYDILATNLFAKSAHVYVRLAEADVARHQAFMATVKKEDLENYSSNIG